MMKEFNYVQDVPKLRQLPSEDTKTGRFYITPSGERVPSVTTVLGYGKRDSLSEWRNKVGHEEANKISRQAATRGTKFHKLMEKYLSNEENILTEDIMPDMQCAFKNCLPTLNRIDNIRYLESPLYSLKHKIAGRTDCIAEFDGTLSVIDFKTSRKLKQEDWIVDYFLQGCAYSLMHEELTEIPIEQSVIIISVDGESKPQIFVRKNKHYIEQLIETVKKYHAENTIHRNERLGLYEMDS